MSPDRRRSGACPLLVLAACLGCGEHRAPEVASGPLPPGLAARAGSEEVRLSTVARIARAQRLTPKQARDRALTDALFAAAARENPADRARVTAAERSVLARAVVEGVRDDVGVRGPVTDEELRALIEQRWPELDRPPSARVTHAVVLVKKPPDDVPARELAAALARAVAGAKDADDFVARAEQLPKGGLELSAERLPPVTPDGRIWDPTERTPRALPGSLDLDFTRAASALEKPGDQSPVVKSSFGYHVIRLEERYPELRFTPDERRARLTPDVLTNRAKRELDALLSRLRARTPVATERASEALTALVAVEP